MPEIRRLAILNRGEPAVRALTAVAELNHSGDRPTITTILVHTDPDAQSWFVCQADEALCLGPATYVDPTDGQRRSRYLDEPYVIDLLLRSRVDAVWVGWGFVAESASFARRCEQAGIVFVGPRSATIGLLGDKVAAKRMAQRVDVPVIPWSQGPVADLGAALEQADRLGYPVMIKASAGGGGRGIRPAADPTELAAAFADARTEATLAFGDDTVFLERLVPAARHVEVQIIADDYGTIWAIGVRDCSIQRRHQKVIEESSSTALDDVTQRAVEEAAVRLMRAAEYRNAGTVEFLYDPSTGRFLFLEVNARLQVEHPVTEATTGLDLVKLQLHVAAGGRLTGSPPPARGHAVEARLCAEDPEHDFAPSPGRLVELTMPTGAGIRVDTGVRQGESVATEFDSMIAKIVAWGGDRNEALSRLRRALADTVVVVRGGTSNRLFLLNLLDHPDLREGAVDNHWLDTLTAAGGHLPAADPIALLVAAIDTYEAEQATDRAAFHARAARGRPEPAPETGHRCTLKYLGVRYSLVVFRTGADTYRIDSGDAMADVVIDRTLRAERQIVVAGRRHRVRSAPDGVTFRVEVDGAAHLVSRDDGGAVRCGWPAFAVSVLVKPGDVVAEGDSLVVLESMKMQFTLTAPDDGSVTSVEVLPNSHVDAGAPLLHLKAITRSDRSALAGRTPLDLRGLNATEPAQTPECEQVYAALSGYLLGYDLDPATLTELSVRQRRLGRTSPPTDLGLLHCEDQLIDLFAEMASLYRSRTESDTAGDTAAGTGAPREYLLAYLQWLDPVQAGLPDGYRDRLQHALGRYGVHGLERTPALEEATVWMFKSFSRVTELVPAITVILERRLHYRAQPPPPSSPRADENALLRARLDRLVHAVQGRHQSVADLAREVCFCLLDEPLLAAVVEQEYSRAQAHLTALGRAPNATLRAARIADLIQSPQPLRGLLLHNWRNGADQGQRRALLEVHLRRYYRARNLGALTFVAFGRHLLASAEYGLDDEEVHVVAAYSDLSDLPALSHSIATHLSTVDPGHKIVVDLSAWRAGEMPTVDALSGQVDDLLKACDFGRPLWRLDVTVTSTGGLALEHLRTQHVTYRQPRPDRAFVEDVLYRNLHPMLAKRLDLWRLANFRLARLPSAEDVYLFHGVAHDNPADQRLFVLAEVRDLTAVVNAAGVSRYPRLELMTLHALSAMRQAISDLGQRQLPSANRIVLHVRPPWTIEQAYWPDLARSLMPLAVGAGLEKLVLRVHLPVDGGLRETVLHLEGLGGPGVTVRERPAGRQPIRSLTPYRQKVLRARRLAAPYPYEIIRMLAPAPGVVGRFPTGRFVEYDLDPNEVLSPVDRLFGNNTCNIVVGLLSNDTRTVPEGMTRVVLLGDPTRGLGNVAEPECRRIIAGIDLAERLKIPVEWFALSSGARIAMNSGTENMDWIAAVLRRLIEFTQGGGEVNIVVTGVNVGAQPYWNAEATMLMHTRGILIMTPRAAMVLTGKQALAASGGVAAEDNFGIGGFDRIMGPNGQAHYWAPTLEDACDTLLAHYDHAYVVPGERFPRRVVSSDPIDRDVCKSPHSQAGDELQLVGDVFSYEHNAGRKKPFDIRAVLRSVTDADSQPVERWAHWREADAAVVWDARVGGIPICLIGLESKPVTRLGYVPADGPPTWTAGTLFPQSSRKLARAVNAASGNRPLVVLANLSGFDGSPESMSRWQLEYGAEIGRAVTNFCGPIVFVVISRYHGGAFVVFSKRLNDQMEIAALEGSYASVIGGAAAAAAVFAREVTSRTEQDPRLRELRDHSKATASELTNGQALRAETVAQVRSEKLGEVADEFDGIHTVERAQAVGSVDRIIPARALRPYLVDALERGMARCLDAAV